MRQWPSHTNQSVQESNELNTSRLSRRNAYLFLGLALSIAPCHAIDYFVELHSGSMQGMAHLSYGLTFSNKHHVALGVGFVPERDNHEAMTLTSFKYRYEGTTRKHWQILDSDIAISPYNFGLSVITGHQDEIYSSLPDHVPDGYYMPTARRILFNYQTVIEFEHDVEAYIDWSILDVGLINYARNFDFYRDNYDFFGLEGIVSYGIGLRKSF